MKCYYAAVGPQVAKCEHGSAGVIVLQTRTKTKDDSLTTTKEAAAQFGELITINDGDIIKSTFGTLIMGVAAQLSEQTLEKVMNMPEVAYVYADCIIKLDDPRPSSLPRDQNNPPSWGLDRVDQENLPLDNAYNYGTTTGSKCLRRRSEPFPALPAPHGVLPGTRPTRPLSLQHESVRPRHGDPDFARRF